MSTRYRDCIDSLSPQFIGNLLQVTCIDMPQIGRSLDGIEECVDWPGRKISIRCRHTSTTLAITTEPPVPKAEPEEMISFTPIGPSRPCPPPGPGPKGYQSASIAYQRNSSKSSVSVMFHADEALGDPTAKVRWLC